MVPREEMSANTQNQVSENTGENEAGKSLECPECGDTLDPRGFRGHLQFQHSITGEDADSLFEKAKKKAKNSTSTRGEGGRSDTETAAHNPAAEVSRDAPQDEIDEVLNDILRRYDQRAKVALVRDLAEDEQGDDDLTDRLRELKEVQELFASERDSPSPEEIARSVAAAVDQGQPQPAADGAGSLVERAVAQGVNDPDTLRELAELSPEKRKIDRKYEFREKMINRVGAALSDSNVTEFVGTVFDRLSEQQGQRGNPEPQQRQPEPEPEPEAEAETESEEEPARSRHAQKYAPGGDDIELADDAFPERNGDDDSGGEENV